MTQSAHDNIEQCINRLRPCEEKCEFGNRATIDTRIRHQIIDKCIRHLLRHKLREKGREVTLDQSLKYREL